MNSKQSLRAHVCLTATTTLLLAGTAFSQAIAARTHVLKHGETIEALGRRYHIPARDILAANHLSASDILRDNRRVTIPDAPRTVNVPRHSHKAGHIVGSRISIRSGPASLQPRVRLAEDGAKVVVTAARGDWLQVTLEDGRSGWVRSDFVKVGAGKTAARSDEEHKNSETGAPRRRHEDEHEAAHRHNLAIAAARRKKQHLSAAEINRRQHLENIAHAKKLKHLHELAVARQRHHGSTSAAARKHHHDNEKLANALRRQEAEAAAAHHHAHAGHAAERRHLEALAAARKHHHDNEALANRLRREEAAHRHSRAGRATERHHLEALAAARKHHHDNEALANRLRHEEAAEKRHHAHAGQNAEAQRHEAALARAHHHDNEARANAIRRHQAALAHAHHHDNEARANALRRHEAALAREHQHHNEKLANYLRRMQAQASGRHHTDRAASTSYQESTHFAHRIRPEAESPSAANDVVRSAFAYRGTPYRWGQSRPGGFDCSGFTKYVYGRKGVSLPRTAAEQSHAGNAVGHGGMKPGDLVFFHTTRSGISHVGMYVGSGKFVHSSSAKSGGVRVDSLESGYYNRAFRGARRVRKETTESSGE